MARLLKLKITALDTEPPVWRRFAIRDDVSFARLHNVLQVLFGWHDVCEHQFTLGGLSLGKPDDRSGFEPENERKYRLSAQIPSKHAVFYYGYDLQRAGWMFEISFERDEPRGGDALVAVCLDGAGVLPSDGLPAGDGSLQCEATSTGATFDCAAANASLREII